MLDSGLIDLVVISTPPNSHYSWAKCALERGVHVVLEKPMALTAEQCDEVMALAAAKNLMLVVYQNRRYDADFVTMKRLIEEGAIGDVFQYDCFVGGYSEPCTYWHSTGEATSLIKFSESFPTPLRMSADRITNVFGCTQPMPIMRK
jgi:predicted dehydrogenase